MNEPRPSDAPAAPSTERLSVALPVPASWLDRLLDVQTGLRLDAPLEESVTQILGVARELLDDVAVGVCIPRPAPTSSNPPPPRSAAPGDITRARPEGRDAAGPIPVRPEGRDASVAITLSPGRPAERAAARDGAAPRPRRDAALEGQLVIRIEADRPSRDHEPDPARLFPDHGAERVIPFGDDGATLHAAADDEARLADGTAAAHLLDRVAVMLSSVVDRQRALDLRLHGLRAQVIQSEKLASLGQIAAGIVHELNNPLTTIVAYSDFLRKKIERKGGDPSDVERLARINEAAERILRFSRDLTAYSRPASEVPAPVVIHDVIERALVFCEHELDKHQVMVERQFGQVTAVRGVAGQLTQVFVNLFTNAAHAMRDAGGMLTISTTMTEEEVEVTISDDGHGIDEGHRDRIFEPFFTTKTDGSGTGLGLSIVRSIVQSHGGHITVGGRDPRGTVFRVGLPTAAAPPSER